MSAWVHRFLGELLRSRGTTTEVLFRTLCVLYTAADDRALEKKSLWIRRFSAAIMNMYLSWSEESVDGDTIAVAAVHDDQEG